MAPKTRRSSTKEEPKGEKRKHEEVEEKPKQDESNAKQDKDDNKDDGEEEETKPNADEQPKEEDEDKEPPAKAPRKLSVLDWLLSDDAFNLANPEIPDGHGEIDWEDSERRKTPPSEDAGKNGSDAPVLRYPQSDLSPFQNLVSASILSKPLSHKLGLRTIQTLLNPPFSIRTLRDLDEAGYEGRRKIMWEARTQHKEKTASLLGDLCDGVKELCGEDEEDLSALQGVRDQIKGLDPKDAQAKVEELLIKIKGIGPGVASIFLRRVQKDWEEVFPYIDDRSLKAAKAFGLVSESGNAEELKDKVGGDREKYVRVVDVLVGLELEKKVEQAVEMAGV